MTPEQQRIAIAEACGWSNVHTAEHGTDLMGFWHGEPRPDLILPNYLNDLNAMHEAEKSLSKSDRDRYLGILDLIVFRASNCDNSDSVVFATAAQRAEAFLRTKGKLEFA